MSMVTTLATEKDSAALAPWPDRPVQHVRVAIVGAGFSGLGMAIRLKQQGYHDFIVLERADDAGGTWRDNSYPGCACDVQSHLYSFSFAPNPNWSRMFSSQREIRAYLRHCIKRFDIGAHIRWRHEVLDASWHEQDRRWRILTSGDPCTAEMLVLGTGPLSEPSIPAIPGMERFTGTVFHSARWNHDHDLAAKRVAVIGTGASAIQFVPRIQPKVGKLFLFQRTAPWIVPRMDRQISRREQALFRALPIVQRVQRAKIYWQRERDAIGMVYRPDILAKAEVIARHHMERQIADPVLREKLTPPYAMGCKRILLSDDFYPALAQDNVELIAGGVRAVTAGSVVAEDGAEHAVDTIILATGFHVSDTPYAAYVHGRDGQSLADAWRDGPQAYLGAAVAGFPNLFICIGPNTGLGHNSMVFMIESQIAYMLDCLRAMDRRSLRTVEVRPDVQHAYNDKLQRRLRGTVWASGCHSWYLHPSGRNTTLWPGFTWEFWLRTRHFDAAKYTLTP
jgi:cation diffusion facilitator CzcD-associated flavoprotein CzcO